MRRFRVKLAIWNEDGKRMDLLTVDLKGKTIEGESTYWNGTTTNLCHSEGLEAAVHALEMALYHAKESLTNAKEFERKTLSKRRY